MPRPGAPRERPLRRTPGGAPPPPPGPRRPLSRAAKLAVAALVALVPASLGAIFLASSAFSPVGARVAPDAVLVERRWVAPVELPVSGISSAAVLPPDAFRGLRRTAGVARARVQYGKFRSDALGPFQLYAWRRGPAVLLETEAGRIVLTPEEPERFAAEVSARLALR